MINESISEPVLNFIPGHSIPSQNTEIIEGIPYIPFPISLHTVDIAMFRVNNGIVEILLGKKPGQDEVQLPGGFMNPGETAEKAASRELGEETILNVEFDFEDYHGSYFIDDPRYKDTPHKITTSLFAKFIPYIESLEAKAGDDLEEVKWFPLDSELPLKSFHKQLVDKLKTIVLF